ncbi:MFS transporter [Cohnella pontilimi]|uniref:MFS transporter n=1 Tax=Cohnella pontilimi TaxID=2564100 RepID=A0A4U0FGQ4_9BACL|nr:MFS transporter [Cohnella pontilimi]TJY44070.1 MFS transporter [Cohnella pontilimi]
MAIIKRAFARPGVFTRLAVLLFLMEWVRGAFLIAFLPEYAVSRLGFDLSLIGLAVSVHYLSDTLIKGFVGALLDRFSAKVVLHAGFLLAMTAFALMMFTHAGWILIAASCLLGIGFSPVWLVCLSQVQEENRASQMGVLYIYWLAGLGLGPVLLNFVMDLGDQAAMLVLTAAFAAGWLVVRKTEVPISSISLQMMPMRQQLNQLWHGIKGAGFLLPGMLLQTTAGGMLVPFLTVFATERLGLTHSEFSAVMMTGGAFAVVSMVPMGKLFDSFGGKWFLVAGFGAIAAALARLCFAQSFGEAVALAIVIGCSYAALLPAWNALMARHVPQESQGAGWGILTSIEGAGVVVGPLLGSWLAAGGHTAAPFWTSAVLLGFISLFYLVVPSAKFQVTPAMA